MIAGLQSSNSWNLIVSLRRRKWAIKGIELDDWLYKCNLMDFNKAEGLEDGQGLLESCLPCLCWPESLHSNLFVLSLGHWVLGKWASFFLAAPG